MRRVIEAANRLVDKPYRSGGGHRSRISRIDTGYDCSGAVSYALLVVAGLRFDTGMRDRNAPGPRTGPRWSRRLRRAAGFVPRHPRAYYVVGREVRSPQ